MNENHTACRCCGGPWPAGLPTRAREPPTTPGPPAPARIPRADGRSRLSARRFPLQASYAHTMPTPQVRLNSRLSRLDDMSNSNYTYTQSSTLFCTVRQQMSDAATLHARRVLIRRLQLDKLTRERSANLYAFELSVVPRLGERWHVHNPVLPNVASNLLDGGAGQVVAIR